jgi:hypothetical protein
MSGETEENWKPQRIANVLHHDSNQAPREYDSRALWLHQLA